MRFSTMESGTNPVPMSRAACLIIREVRFLVVMATPFFKVSFTVT